MSKTTRTEKKPIEQYDHNGKARVSGPFTVEAVPAPVVKPLSEIKAQAHPADISVARSGETLQQSEWRAELLKCGIRGKNGQYIQFSRVEPLAGVRWLHADAQTKPNDLGAASVKEGAAAYLQRAVISFGPEHAPLERRQVELAWEEARMTRIGRIFKDIINPCVSVSSVQSVFPPDKIVKRVSAFICVHLRLICLTETSRIINAEVL